MARHSSSPNVAPWLRVAAVRRFVDTYGWRAYALPVLVIVTVLSVAQPGSGTRAAQRVVVSISRQRAWLCAAGRLVRSTAVTSGTLGPDTATPTGTWRVYAKQTDRFLTGPGYREFVTTGCRSTATSASTTRPGRPCPSAARSTRNTAPTGACTYPVP